MPRLGVNVDHVATLRQARRGTEPNPVQAALAAQRAGCDSIVCHLREDRRHIQDQDLREIRRVISIPLNLEMSAHPEIVRIACRVKPAQATLVPERRQELTTEGGLDLTRDPRRLESAIRRLQEAGVRVSLFVDPDLIQIERASSLAVPMIELHTGRYAGAKGPPLRRKRFNDLKRAARHASSAGLAVAAGHGLDYQNAGPVARILEVEELNIGFSIVARAMEVGFFRAVREMVKLLKESDPKGFLS